MSLQSHSSNVFHFRSKESSSVEWNNQHLIEANAKMKVKTNIVYLSLRMGFIKWLQVIISLFTQHGSPQIDGWRLSRYHYLITTNWLIKCVSMTRASNKENCFFLLFKMKVSIFNYHSWAGSTSPEKYSISFDGDNHNVTSVRIRKSCTGDWIENAIRFEA